MQWDSEQLGIPCGNVLFSANEVDGKDLARAMVKIIPDKELLTVIKIPTTHIRTKKQLIQWGATDLGDEVTFCFSKSIAEPKSSVKIIITNQFKYDVFLSLAETMSYSRFALDNEISQPLALALWRKSISNHCRGRASALAVGYIKNQPAGIVAALDTAERRNLFLVGVLPCFQKKGVGLSMLDAIVRDAGTRRVLVEAFAANTPAVSLYSHAGFIAESTHCVLHLWKNRLTAG